MALYLTSFEVIGLSKVSLNKVYAGASGCCGVTNINLKILPGANYPLTITEIYFSNGSCTSYNPTMVDGQIWASPLTTPIIVNVGDLIPVQIPICSCVGAGSGFQGVLTIIYDDPINGTGVVDETIFDFIETNFATDPPFTDTYVNHYPCIGDPDCPEQPGFLYFTNPTVVDYWVSIICGTGALFRVDGVSVPSFPAPSSGLSFLAKAGETYKIESYICPEAGNVSWCVDFEICGDIWSNTYGCLLFIDNPVQCGPCDVSCQNISVFTENDPSIIDSYSGSCAGVSSTLIANNAIGVKKIIEWTLQYNNNFFGGNIDIYFNPWLFSDNCNFASKYGTGIIDSPPPVGFWFRVQPTHIADGIYHDMTLVGAGVNGPSQKNWTAKIKVFTDMTLVIKFEFYHIEDLENWLDSSPVPNRPKLLNNNIAAPSELTNTTLSVYNSDKKLCLLFYIVDPKIQVPVPGSPSLTQAYQCYFISSIDWTARFYNKGLYDGPSEMTSPVFEFERNGTIVPGLASYAKTKITFRVNSPSPIDNCIFWVIDAQDLNDTIDFKSNYDSSRAFITTDGSISVIDNKLQSPSVGPTLISGTTYEVSAYIGGGISGSGQYYVIAIPFSSIGNLVNSFITGPVPVTPVPGVEGCCPPELESFTWYDYKNGKLGSCFTPTMKERIANAIQITPGDFGTCLENYGWDPEDFDWFFFAKSVKLNIYRKVENYPSSGITTFFMYEQHQANRVAGIWTGIDPEGLYVSETPPSKIDASWKGRVRYESDIPIPNTSVFIANSSTPLNRTPAGGMAPIYIATQNANYNWADLDIYFEYIFTFDLSWLFGGNPCEFNQVYISKAHPIDFETTPDPYSSMFKPLLVEGVKGAVKTTITGQFCKSDFDYLLVTMESHVAEDGFLVALLDKYPFGINNLLEHDASAPTTILAQLTAPEMYDVDSVHIGVKSNFKIDLSSLSIGKYQICGVFIDKKP